ncbi:Cysteine desulfurase IscS 2 [uncultured archaeon]|nr:Cysteine desulfurase IscS 2 [uncultured archaeon]
MREIYFDNSATTPVDSRVLKAMLPFLGGKYGNPGSFHSKGMEAKKAVDRARKIVAGILGCRPEEVIFTGSGTESCNLAIKGAAFANKEKGKHIITSKIEHHAVLHSCEWLEKQGFEVTYLDVDRFGMVRTQDVEKAMRKDTILVSVMYANNEIGTIQPIREIAEICHRHGALFHTDACQGAGLLDINVKNSGADLLTLNGSKIYAPKGTGALFVKEGTKIEPLIHGGNHEFGIRAGTENVAGIVGLATGLQICQKERKKEARRLSGLRDYFIRELTERIQKTTLNGHPKQRLPGNVNVSFLDVEGESILLCLDKEGIYASTGSACSSQSLEPSHVILATGLPYEAAHGSIRFSLGKSTTKKEIDFVLWKLPPIIRKLRIMSPVKLEDKATGAGK